MIEISKKLLSEVLKCDVTHFTNYDKSIFRYETENARNFINIYELAYLMKEWALSKGYNLWSGYAPKDKNFAVNLYLLKENIEIDCDESLSNTEVESIFKACELIQNETISISDKTNL